MNDVSNPAATADSYTAGKEQLPLHGITVLDLTLARAGPTCVRHLADWGANIIRIEPPEAGSEDLTGRREGFDFQNLHRNKRMVRLNLKAPEGHAAFMRLVEKADVIIENMRAAVKHRLNVAYDDVRKVNPRIVYGSISGFGQTGPYGKRAGVDQIVQGMGGLMSITGLPGQGPVRVGLPIADLTAGNLLAMGVTMALFDRTRTGVGKWVHTSLLEAQIFMLDFQASRWLISKEVAKQAGNDHPTGIPTGVFPSSDGHFNIAASSSRVFARFCEAIGKPEWKDKDGMEHGGEAERRAQGDQRGDQRDHAHQARGALGGALRGGRRAVRTDLQHRPDVRRSAGEASGDGNARQEREARRAQCRRQSDQHGGPAAQGLQRRRRRRAAHRRGAGQRGLHEGGNREAAREWRGLATNWSEAQDEH